MEIEIEAQEIPVIPVDQLGTRLRDMVIPQLFAHYRAVLGLYQAIIIGVAGPAFGETDQELVKELGHCAVYKTRTRYRNESL